MDGRRLELPTSALRTRKLSAVIVLSLLLLCAVAVDDSVITICV